MNYTEKYHLPQWEETDRIMRTDFNRMCQDMEAGLNKTAADAAADTEKAVASAAAAQTTADNAVAKANAAQATANAAYCPTNLPYVFGTYTGNNGTLTVKLGFKPKFVIISGQKTMEQNYFSYSSGVAIAGCGINVTGLTLLNNGFTVSYLVIAGAVAAPNINSNGTTYAYIAFR